MSPAEEEAVANKKAGLPCNKADYNSAQQKLRQGGKYRGEINVQKRQSNFSLTVPPFSPIIMTPVHEHALATATLVAGAAALSIAAIALIALAFL